MTIDFTDPAPADDMTDQQLADLIDGHLDSISEGQPDEDMNGGPIRTGGPRSVDSVP